MKDLGNTWDEVRANMPEECQPYLEEIEKAIIDENIEQLNDIEGALGGKFYLVESTTDLFEIKTLITNPKTDTYYAITEHPDAFDMCEWLDEEQTYLGVSMFTNNSGGNVYIVPAEYVNETILQSIEETRQCL